MRNIVENFGTNWNARWSNAFILSPETLSETPLLKSFLHETPTNGGSSHMATTYRRRKGKDTWHFCTNCRHWPTKDYESRTEKPTTGEFCDQCKSKRSNKNCK